MRAFAAAIAFATLAAAQAAPARAQSTKSYWFVGTNLIFAKAQAKDGETAVAADDPGLGRFLGKLGATISYDPGQRYAIVTTGDRRSIVFTAGDARYTVAGLTQSAPFAPYQAGGTIYLSLSALAKALYVVPVEQDGTVVLQPQVGALDVRTQNGTTYVSLHSALPIKFQRVSGPSDERLSVSLGAVGTSLAAQRAIAGSPVRAMSFQTAGSARNPATVVSFDVAPGTAHVLAPAKSPNELVLAFSSRASALAGMAPVPASGDASSGGTALAARIAGEGSPSAPTNEYAPLPSDVPVRDAVPPPPLAAVAHVTAVDEIPAGDGMTVRVGVSSPVSYEWHRLSDNRWYVDLTNAVLDTPAREDQPRSSAVTSLRVKQLSPGDQPVVRIALTLASQRRIDVGPAQGGFALAIASDDDTDGQRVGAGRVTSGAVIASGFPAPQPVTGGTDLWSRPAAPPAPTVPRMAAGTNPRLIVIDPGHGGSDAGSIHNGLVEKELNLDMARRLRKILTDRGWLVVMTRDSDVDVYGPNASAHDELQARCEVANQRGARLFISIHSNAYEGSGPMGTTTYYYTPESVTFASMVHARLAATLPTKDDGMHKENYYVIRHATMPSILVESAFLSNPTDAKYLRSPAFLQALATAIADGVDEYTQHGRATQPDAGT